MAATGKYTAEEQAFVAEHYPAHGPVWVAEQLGRPVNSVRSHAYDNKIKFERKEVEHAAPRNCYRLIAENAAPIPEAPDAEAAALYHLVSRMGFVAEPGVAPQARAW